jgi:hypothetical protein
MPRLKIALAGLVATIWATGYILAYIGQLPGAPAELSALMAIVLGWALGETTWTVIRNRRNGNGNGS